MLPELLEDLNIIQALGDYPNDEDGLSSAELKERFDRAPNLIKIYINEVLLPAIKALNTPFASTPYVEADNVQDAIENVQRQAAEAAAGTIPEGSVSLAKLTLELQNFLTTLRSDATESKETLIASVNPLTWNDAGQTLDSMHLGASGKYAEDMLCEIFRDLTKIASNQHLYLHEGVAELVTSQGMVRCGAQDFEEIDTKPNKSGCRELTVNGDLIPSSTESEVMRFRPYNFFQTTKLHMKNTARTSASASIRITDGQNTVWSGTETFDINQTKEITASILLEPGKVYQVLVTPNNLISFGSAYFSGTETLYTSGNFTSVQTPTLVRKTARVLLRGVDTDDLTIKLIAGGETVTMDKDEPVEDHISEYKKVYDERWGHEDEFTYQIVKKDCELLSASCEVPDGASQATVKIEFGSTSAKVFDYALIFV